MGLSIQGALTLLAALIAARQADETEEYALQAGQTCGLINEIKPAGEIVREIVEQAEIIIRQRLSRIVAEPALSTAGSEA